jgi:outer membrane protein
MKESILESTDFSNNLEILQASIAVKIAQLETTNAFDAHYPTLDLEASLTGYDTDDPTTDSLYRDISSVMLKLNIPIYSGGATSSRVREKRLMTQSSTEDLLDIQKKVQVKYDEYMARLEASIESVSMYKSAYESALLYVDSIEKGYNHGLKSIIDLNDAKNKQYEVTYKYIENIYEMVDSYIGLLIITNDFKNIDLLDKLVE